MKTLLVATTNTGKWREIRRILAGVPVQLLSLADVPPVPEPEEPGNTFAENARVKADYYARHARLATVAEDSGLDIDALGGRPGVQSARYPGATYPEKFANLYRELAPFPRPWHARFTCALAVMPSPEASSPEIDPLFACEASVEGEIVPAAHGTHGFGYDPIFLYPPYGRTFGDVDDEQKTAVSHRGQAFRRLRDWLIQVKDHE
jgi:XTP/dITP diphosphohydrolase